VPRRVSRSALALVAGLVVVAVPVALAEPKRDSLGAGAPPARVAAPAVQTVASGLEVPWEIAFLPDGRALITERPGRVRMLTKAGRLLRRPVARVDVSAQGEGGLLGLALDPAFKRNRLVYMYFTTARGMRLARYRLTGNRLRRQRVILGSIEAGDIHDSGRIAFGPDAKLYIATGDAGDTDLPQRRSSRNGKFLRMSPGAYRGGGGRAEIVSIGHRNPQGFDWQTGSGRLVATEHGDTGNDEVNVIRRGANYGWPVAEGRAQGGRFTAPIALYSPSVAPSGATFVTRPGSRWTGNYLFAALTGERIQRLVISPRGRVVSQQALYRGRFGRLRAVVEGPGGFIYALTSNQDGRGSPTGEDDRVLRFRPPPR